MSHMIKFPYEPIPYSNTRYLAPYSARFNYLQCFLHKLGIVKKEPPYMKEIGRISRRGGWFRL